MMRKPNILIVDDEKKFTDTFAQFLTERFNANVFVRNNAIDGIEFLDQERVDVLFQDMVLPGLNGEFVINHLKDLNRIDETIVFIISGWNSDIHTQRYENFDLKYIPKPISLITTQKVLAQEFESMGGFDYKKRF